MVALLTAIHVLVALILILAVLLQSARGTDLAGAFGGMGSQAAFGPRGTATFLSKATVVLAVVFMLTSVSLAILANRSAGEGESILSGEEAAPAATETVPASPVPGVPAGSPVGVQTEGLPPGVEVTVEQPDQPAAPPSSEPSSPPAAPSTNP